MGEEAYVMKWKRALSFLLVAVLALLFFANACMRASIRSEEVGRLADPAIQEALAEIAREGSPELPAVLLLHGFAGSPNDLRPLADRIPPEFTVHAPLLPGHGGASARDLSRPAAGEWERAAHGAAEELRAGHEELIIVGFSYGGMLALDVANARPVRAVILVNPYTSVPYKPYYILPVGVWQRLAAPILPYVRKLRSGQINSPEGRARYIPSYDHVSLRASRRMHASASSIRESLVNIDGASVHIHISEGDIVSDPARMQDLAERLGIPPDQVHPWPNSNHVLLYDHDAEAAIEAMLAVIEEPRREE